MSKTIYIKNIPFIVDDDDYEKINQYQWSLLKSQDNRLYARINIFMHREIMGFPKNMIIDHIDRNGLNNCKNNLRICTRKENSCKRYFYI